eukprot:4402254-Pleurochrysis_carterae.AAC.1
MVPTGEPLRRGRPARAAGGRSTPSVRRPGHGHGAGSTPGGRRFRRGRRSAPRAERTVDPGDG